MNAQQLQAEVDLCLAEAAADVAEAQLDRTAVEADRIAQDKRETERIAADIPEKIAAGYRKGQALVLAHHFDGSEYQFGLPQNRVMEVRRLLGVANALYWLLEAAGLHPQLGYNLDRHGRVNFGTIMLPVPEKRQP